MQIAEIPPEIIGDNDDSDIRNEIKKSFLEQQKWSTFDQKRHDLIIKGPGSINEESNELQDEEDITVNILECYSPKRSIPFDDLARRVLQSHHSPSLKRQKKQYKISNESSTGSQELRNIERATRESMEDFHISYSLKGSDSADSFDEGLRLALQISIEDTESLTKAQGKRPMK